MNLDKVFQQFIFWSVWLLIPLLWEIIAGFLSALTVIFKYHGKKPSGVDFYPTVAILIPVCHSENTIKMCLESIANQDYPLKKLEAHIIDNGVKDRSYDVFSKFQTDHPEIKIWWHYSQKGKSKALNKGVFGTSAKYVINIDSDGRLDKNAVKSIIEKFENDDKISCLTGVILTDPNLIEKTNNKILRLVQRCEFFEYTEAFLVGRNYQSVRNTMYTMSGAFSCFKRETIMKTQMYNCETVGEDTHMTFQIREFIGGKIQLCENAFFYVDPIENIDKLYTQRQRWQRGEIEVANLFLNSNSGGLFSFFRKFSMRVIVSDHTLAFPRLIWFFAIIYLFFINYPLKLLVGANLLLYIAYVLNSALYMYISGMYLKSQKEIRKYMFRHRYIVLLLPVYRFFVYWVRIAGIINSQKTESKWRAPTFTEEVGNVKGTVSGFLKKKFPFLYSINKIINRG